jgi:predicted alpha-1,2-mannosidase
VTLVPAGIRAELTVTPRVGVHRYTFPAGVEANVLIDLGAVVQRGGDNRPLGIGTGGSIGGWLEFISATEVVGRGDYSGGWGHDFPYSVYFYARFDRPALRRLTGNHAGITYALASQGTSCTAVAGFGEATQVNLQVGVSFVSVANARASVEREAAGRGFDEIRAAAADTWEKSLSRIEVSGGTPEEKKLFYTLFTRLICMPSDLGVDDENPAWKSGVRSFSDYYCLWDSVRNANSLLGLFDPELEVDMLNCLLDVADHVGWIPDAWIAGHSAHIQGGSSADILICEAALKGFKGINYEKALLQMRKNNEVESPNPRLYGRYLPDYRDLGYLSTNVRLNCVSRHLEYAYQDWCIGALAEKIGQKDVAARYFQGSLKAWNLWREDIRFFAPKLPTGEWVNPFDPAKALPDAWNDPYFYEGTSRQWSFSVHHDFAGLIRRHGGAEAFVHHLDDFFDGGHYHSKETMLHVPYLYIYAGRPELAAEKVRWAMQKFFNTSRKGLSDNEDMGCQSAFYMCSAMGVYPIMGQDLYLLTAPVFERTIITLGASKKTLTIEAPGAGAKMKYIRSASLNGKPLDRAWIRHGEISGGATLTLELGETPGDWGGKIPPPSPMNS